MHWEDALRIRVDEILHYVWDPIGIKDVPQCRDEYDAYLPGVMSLLEAGAGADQIALYLGDIGTEKMGLGRNPSKENIAARIIMNYFEYLKEPSESNS